MFLRFSASKRISPNQHKGNAFSFLRAFKQRVAFKKRLVQCECGSGGKWQRADSLFFFGNKQGRLCSKWLCECLFVAKPQRRAAHLAFIVSLSSGENNVLPPTRAHACCTPTHPPRVRAALASVHLDCTLSSVSNKTPGRNYARRLSPIQRSLANFALGWRN